MQSTHTYAQTYTHAYAIRVIDFMLCSERQRKMFYVQYTHIYTHIYTHAYAIRVILFMICSKRQRKMFYVQYTHTYAHLYTHAYAISIIIFMLCSKRQRKTLDTLVSGNTVPASQGPGSRPKKVRARMCMNETCRWVTSNAYSGLWCIH